MLKINLLLARLYRQVFKCCDYALIHDHNEQDFYFFILLRKPFTNYSPGINQSAQILHRFKTRNLIVLNVTFFIAFLTRKCTTKVMSPRP